MLYQHDYSTLILTTGENITLIIKFKNYLRNFLYRYNDSIGVILKLYLFLRFKIDILRSFLYLTSKWNTLNEAKIPLTFIKQIQIENQKNFTYNPTVIYWNNELLCFARISNLSLRPMTNFWEKDISIKPDKDLMNGIVTFTLDSNFRVMSQKILIPLRPIPNFEDPKVFVHNYQLLLTCNQVMQIPKDRNSKLICKVAIYNQKDGKFLSLNSPTNRNIEKNWIPIPKDGNRIEFIYESLPDTIISFNLNSTSGKVIKSTHKLNQKFHGGSQFLKLDNNLFIRVARRKIRLPKKGLIVISFILAYDNNFNFIFVSNPFIFKTFGFEVCNGLTILGEDLIFTWGENDQEMFAGKIDRTRFLIWLNSVSKNHDHRGRFWKLRREILKFISNN